MPFFALFSARQDRLERFMIPYSLYGHINCYRYNLTTGAAQPESRLGRTDSRRSRRANRQTTTSELKNYLSRRSTIVI